MDEYARSAQEAASTAQYRFTESERKSTEKATMAHTATMAETKDVTEEFEKTKNPATMVRSLPVSEYGARTPARSFEYAYCPASEAQMPASEAVVASENTAASEKYAERSSETKSPKGYATAQSARIRAMTMKLL